jgi:hypothetical protein
MLPRVLRRRRRPAGHVTLADRRTERRWSVELEGYLVGTTPVTQAAFADVTGASPSSSAR